MWIFDFLVLSVITARQNVPTPHINKSYLPIVSLNARELELKRPVKEKGSPLPVRGCGNTTLPAKP